jgi:hypothetical protein
MFVSQVRKRPAWLTIILLAACLQAVAADQPPRVSVVELLRSLVATGVDVLYSSELVPPSLDAPESAPGSDPMSRVVSALAVHHLMLRSAGPRQYVVTRAPIPPAPAVAAESTSATPPRDVPHDAPLEDVAVFASRYEFTTSSSGEPFEFDGHEFEQIPGAQEDAMRALRTAPGFATNLSARPYVRGALLDDVLIEFDGIPLSDPFHFRNFQSVISAFDPSTVSRADVFTGGFPVRYGTRSGAVIALAPRSIESGREYSVGASLLGYDFRSVGRAERWPIEWLVGARLSGDRSALPPHEDDQGEPKYSDLIGRIGWTPNATSSLTLGWLALDDRVRLVSNSSQQATARSRDVNSWLKWDWTPSADLKSQTSFVVANTERYDKGDLNLPDIAIGSLSAERSFSSAELRSHWTYIPSPATSWDFGGELVRETADLWFSRVEILESPIALDFRRPADATISSSQTPHSSTLGLFASFHRHWRSFEAEAGLRLDGQAYEGFGTRRQLSPRINMRYDPTDNWHAYASWGEFTQAQRVDEYRAEENQVTPDSANRAIHLIVGVAHDSPGDVFWRLEAYRNYWSTISPYFDNVLNEASLLPQLQPDRVLIAANHAEAAGIELTAQRSFDHGLTIWALYSSSTATDEVSGQDIPRSWDQRHAANVGFAWSQPQTSASVLFGWHSGWPSTPLSWTPGTGGSPAVLAVGARNSVRWGDYFSVDLRLSTSVPLRRGVLSLWFDATNVTNRPNECCFELNSAGATAGPSVVGSKMWSPRVINAGFTWLVRRPH